MKSKLLIVLVLVLILSCSNDDNSQNNTTQNETVNGTWHLKNVYGGFIPVNINYNLGEVKWTFNEAEGTLIIENNILTTGPEDIHAGLDSGTYNFEITQINNEETLYVNGEIIGVIAITDQNLDIDNGLALDGFLSKYER